MIVDIRVYLPFMPGFSCPEAHVHISDPSSSCRLHISRVAAGREDGEQAGNGTITRSLLPPDPDSTPWGMKQTHARRTPLELGGRSRDWRRPQDQERDR